MTGQLLIVCSVNYGGEVMSWIRLWQLMDNENTVTDKA